MNLAVPLDPCESSRWSVGRAFAPTPSNTERFRPYTEVECIKCNETWQGSRLINYLFIGVYFNLCACYCDVIYNFQIWHQKNIQERNGKNLILVSCIEFYDFW